jgi:hypothetical protein
VRTKTIAEDIKRLLLQRLPIHGNNANICASASMLAATAASSTATKIIKLASSDT